MPVLSHPNEINLIAIRREGRAALSLEAIRLGKAHIEAFNEQVARQLLAWQDKDNAKN